MTTAVEPLRETLLAQVGREREEALADAERRAGAILAEAEREGRALVEQARADGAAAAGATGSRECAEARRRARAALLAARRELFDELGRRAAAAAQDLRGSPGYAALLERLAATARAQLGRSAEVEVDAAGGIRARAGARSVDYTLPTLVTRCIDWLGADVERLWR